MGLLSFLKRKSGDAAPPPRTQAAPAPAHDAPDSVQQARTRARQRLIGAVVLVGAGVIGFPLLFETQPRPLPVDIPIEIARKDGSVAPVPAPRVSTRPAPVVTPPPSNVIVESAADAGREVVPASSPAAASAPAAPVVAAAAPKPVPAAPKPAAASAPTAKPAAKPPVDSARAQALLDGKDSGKKPAAADGRFIVQVGAFSEATAAREARQKVEKLGLKTYTQVVETSSGNRIRVRVGPFASREEADKAAGKIKSAGLPSAVYTL